MGEAFDAACEGLQDTGQPALVREIIAKALSKRRRRASVIRFVCAMRDWPLSDTTGSDLGASRTR